MFFIKYTHIPGYCSLTGTFPDLHERGSIDLSCTVCISREAVGICPRCEYKISISSMHEHYCSLIHGFQESGINQLAFQKGNDTSSSEYHAFVDEAEMHVEDEIQAEKEASEQLSEQQDRVSQQRDIETVFVRCDHCGEFSSSLSDFPRHCGYCTRYIRPRLKSRTNGR